MLASTSEEPERRQCRRGRDAVVRESRVWKSAVITVTVIGRMRVSMRRAPIIYASSRNNLAEKKERRVYSVSLSAIA